MAQSTIPWTQASLIANPVVGHPSLYDGLYRMDQFFAKLPFVAIRGRSLKVPHVLIQDNVAAFNTYNSIGDRFVRAMDPTGNPGTDLTAANDTKIQEAYQLNPTTPWEFHLKRFTGDVIINSAVLRNASSDNPQAQHQIAMKLLALRYQYCDTLFNGPNPAANPDQTRDFRGIDNMFTGTAPTLAATQSRAGTLGAGSIPNIETDLAALVHMVQGANGRCDFIVMNPIMYAVLLRNLSINGAILPSEWDPVLKARIPLYHGVPVYRSRFVTIGSTEPVPPTATISTNVFAGVFGFGEGCFGMYQEDEGENGVTVEHLGPMPTTDAHQYRVSWMAGFGFCGLNSLARLTYTTAAFPVPISV
ncbi:MAG: hypothetical protein L0216_11195 [Planctomycetales bacterium]|nr:hypothetical protein [Planctomycetales bacterium]